MALNPCNAMPKKTINTKFLQNYSTIKYFKSFKVVKEDDKPKIVVELKGTIKRFAPEEIITI